MAMTVQEGVKELKKKHKDLYPIWYTQTGQKILVGMLQRGTPKEDSLANIFLIDLTTGVDVGPIPPMLIYGDDKYEKLLKNIHKISPEDQSIEHSILGNESGNGWKVRHTFDASDIYGDSLSHHGIKGQRWGERNGPPYPLKPSMHSTAEKKAAKSGNFGIGSADHESNKKMGLRDKLNENAAKRGDEFLKANTEEDLTEVIDRSKTKKVDKKSIAKELAIDTLFTLINPVNAITFVEKGVMSTIAHAREKKFSNKRRTQSEMDPETGLFKKTEGEYSEKEDLQAVNPGFMNMASNTKNNCMLCTTTYELRKRGYDVTAQPDSEGYNFKDLKRWYPDAKLETNTRRDESGKAISHKQYIEKTMASFSKYEDGAHGNLMVQWSQGGGHSVYWEKQNGKLIIKDGQTGTVYKDPMKLLSQTNVNMFARLDNVEPDLDVIKRECVQ